MRRAALPPRSAPAILPRDHAIDTINAGDGLSIDAAVDVLVEDGVRYVHELLEWGVRFDRDRTGALSLGREGAHGRRRVLHAADATGREIGRTLWDRVAEQSRVRVERNARVHELIVRGERCIGARYANQSGVHEVHASAVLLATGGAGQVFRETTNPPIATGDGVMLAGSRALASPISSSSSSTRRRSTFPARRASFSPKRYAARAPSS